MTKSKITTDEQIRQQYLENTKSEMERGLQFCPTPTYFYKSGQVVKYVNFNAVKIIDTLYDGRYYLIELTRKVMDDSIGRYTREAKGIQEWRPWYQLRPVSQTKETLVQNEDCRLHFSTCCIDGIISNISVIGASYLKEKIAVVVYYVKVRATGERRRINRSYAIRYHNASKSRATIERTITNRSNAITDYHTGEARAIIERIITNRSNAIRYINAHEARARLERIITNRSNAIRYINASEAIALTEGIIVYSSKSFRDNYVNYTTHIIEIVRITIYILW